MYVGQSFEVKKTCQNVKVEYRKIFSNYSVIGLTRKNLLLKKVKYLKFFKTLKIIL